MFVMRKIKEDFASCSGPDVKLLDSLAMRVDLCFYGMVDAMLGFLRILFYNTRRNLIDQGTSCAFVLRKGGSNIYFLHSKI
jgi:hypothetical protein